MHLTRQHVHSILFILTFMLLLAAPVSSLAASSADMIKIAMINISDDIKMKKMKTRMIMQVHDELVFEVPEDELDAAKKMVVDRMEHALDLAVPVKVDVGV